MKDNPASWTPDTTPITIYNPLSHDVIIDRRNDDNTMATHTLSAMTAVTHPAYLAVYLKRHLVDHIINERHLVLVTPEKRAEIERECLV